MSANITSQPSHWTDGDFGTEILELVGADPRFRSRYESGPAWWRHLVYAALETQHVAVRIDRRGWAQRLATEPAQRLVVAIFGASIPGMRHALGKLGPSAARRMAYRRLFDCLMDPRRRKFVQHAERLDSDRIDALWVLDREALSFSVVDACPGLYATEVVNYAVGCVRSSLPKRYLADAWRSLRQQRDLAGVHRWLLNWLKRLPFPSPPWRGSVHLRPITDGFELARQAKAFGNCAVNHIGMMIDGRTALYLWAGTTPTMVQVTRDPFHGWVVEQITCRENALPHDALKAEILDHFRQVGITYRPTHIFRALYLY